MNVKETIQTAKNHMNTERITCNVCTLSFSSKRGRNTHYKNVHLNLKNYFCDKCDYSCFGSSGMKQHAKKHQPKTKCPECGLSLSSTYLRPHMKARHGQIDKFNCKMCEYTSAYSNNIKKHQKAHLINPEIRCQICSIVFGSSTTLKAHNTTVHNLPKEMFKCTQCDYEVICQTRLKYHMATHSNDRPFSCPHCSKSFSTKPNLNVHVDRIHVLKKNHKCKFCDYQCFKKYQLKAHMLRMHTEQDEKLFKCNQCDKFYKEQRSLKLHVLRVHKENKYRIMVCSLCDFKTFDKKLLASHTNTKHQTRLKDFQCKSCRKCFFGEKYLNKHLKSHSKEKPFKCRKCDFSAKLKIQVEKHEQRTHGNREMQICDICEKQYSKDYLAKHKTRIHKGI